jgi:hypothetical protein
MDERGEQVIRESDAQAASRSYSKVSSAGARLIETDADRAKPSVTIRIGRIEVRAIMPEKPPPKKETATLSLEEYLKRRRERAF